MSELRLNTVTDKDTDKGVNVDALHYQNTQLVRNLGPWQPGLVFENKTDYATFNDQAIITNDNTTLPYTAQGIDPTVAPDSGNVVPFEEVTKKYVSDNTIGNLSSIRKLSEILSPSEGQKVNVASYHDGWAGINETPTGGGVFVWGSSRPKSNHNGVTVFDPDAPFPVDWSDTSQQSAWFTASNSGNGCWVRQYTGAVNTYMAGAIGDGISPCGYLVQHVINKFQYSEALQGSFYLESPVILPTKAKHKGLLGGDQHGNQTAYISDRNALGESGVMFTAGGGATTQGVSLNDVMLKGDTSGSYSDLSLIESQGIYGIDPSGVKNGLDLSGVSYYRLKGGVKQLLGNGYIDAIRAERSHFTRCYECLDMGSTTVLDISDSQFYDNYSLGSVGRVFGKNVVFNNSSFSTNRAGLSFTSGVFEGIYIEGYNNTLQPSRYLKVSGSYFSESFSTRGWSKFTIRPQGNGVTIELEGTRVGENTRLYNLDSAVTDVSTLNIKHRGLYNIGRFANEGGGGIFPYLKNGIRYEGSGNENTDWNVAVSQGRQLLGDQVDVSNTTTEQRLPSLNRKVFWKSSISFTLTYDREHPIEGTAYGILSSELFEAHLVGFNNGAGGYAAYHAKVLVFNGYNSTWDAYIEGRDSSLFSVTISNQGKYSVDVLIEESHNGFGDMMVFTASTSAGQIKFNK